MNSGRWPICCRLALASLLALGVGMANAARVSDIRSTKHNLSSTAPAGNIKATSETQVCVYCHTPHGASLAVDAQGKKIPSPLWNRTIPEGSTYKGYTWRQNSSSLDSADITANYDGLPGGSSKLCLSCHDGTIAVGQVNVLNGKTTPTQVVAGLEKKLSEETKSLGSGATTGFTRDLGVDLSNDHPISVTYNSTLVTRDTEMRAFTSGQSFVSGGTTYLGLRQAGQSGGARPKVPLEPTDTSTTPASGQVQCASCHDPHITEKSTSAIDYARDKFLRMPRFQKDQPDGTFKDTDIICKMCHDKEGGLGAYSYSVHANSNIATQSYITGAATLRDFYSDGNTKTTTLKVWQASCLNCHDPHTVEGSRRLLREGTDGTLSAADGTGYRSGGNPAIENTCYQCHTGTGAVISTTDVPNIATDFGLALHMPITQADQMTVAGNDSEAHNIGRTGAGSVESGLVDTSGGKCSTQTGSANGCATDFVESQVRLGVGALGNRHVECTDCHNPHRIMKMRLFYARESAGLAGEIVPPQTAASPVGYISTTSNKFDLPDGDGTHLHYEKEAYLHTNIASGVLRGTWGVEPSWADASFHTMPNSFTVKRGHPTGDAGGFPPPDYPSGANIKTYVTREYQICLKCHSNYGYSDDNKYPGGDATNPTGTPAAYRGVTGRPLLQSQGGGTPKGSLGTGGTSAVFGLYAFTNQAKEFQAPSTHRGAPANVGGSGADATYSSNNHRSWHPVLASTGRTLTVRGITNKDTGTNASWPWRQPWMDKNGAATPAAGLRVGNQTMYCTDCHGTNTATETVIPANNGTGTTVQNGNPWGPHGSTNNFLLKGLWGSGMGATGRDASYTSNFLCFKCHDKQTYADGTTGGNDSGAHGNNATGFCCGNKGNLHQFHTNKLQKLYCVWCHVAVPHGWKNKALLVNLNDVGLEAGEATSAEVRIVGSGDYFSRPPYYLYSKLKVNSFATSGNWSDTNCGSSNRATKINSTNGQTNNTTGTGKNWMISTCDPPTN